ncbi:MAG: helix-turn-helix domain-containing protein [Fusobacterium ulcerans]|uniref:helix-turn-helix domain-containing protein n=1 Tax=Fusobacterium ulcerans TaxID=861 RepID=UPI003A8A47A2
MSGPKFKRTLAAAGHSGGTEGDEKALAAILNHYKGYIRFLAMRPMKDEYGNEHLCVDEDMRLRLEAKLLYSIVTGFKVLPV